MKRMVLSGVLVLALSILALPVFAVPTQNLTSLANFYPEDTFMYFGFRTDAAFVDEIEALAGRFADAEGGDTRAFSEELDAIAQAMTNDPEATFAESIQPLLGSVGAFGILDGEPLFDDNNANNIDSGYLIALSITDRAVVQSFFSNNAAFMSEYEAIEDSSDYAIFGPNANNTARNPTYLYFGNNVLLVATDMALLPQAELSVRLSDNTNFSDTMNMLPAGDYAVAGFINPAGLLASLNETMADEFEDAEFLGNMFAMYAENYHGVGLGFTVLDQNNLIMDVSLNADLEAAAESMGMPLPEFGAVDLAFASRVPANAALVVFYPDLAQAISQGVEQLGTMMEMQQQMLEEMGVDSDQFENAEDQIAAMQAGIQMITGGTLEESFGWASGQGAFAAGIDFTAFPNGFNSPPTRNPIGVSFVAENVDGGAQQLYDGLTAFIERFASSAPDLAVSEKEIVGGEATNIAITIDDTPFPIEVQIAVTDSIFVIGTPDYVEAALTGDGGIGSTAAFQNAASVSLGDTPAYVYIALEPIVTRLGMNMSSGSSMQALGLFESMSFSGHIGLPSSTSIRYVFSLVAAE